MRRDGGRGVVGGGRGLTSSSRVWKRGGAARESGAAAAGGGGIIADWSCGTSLSSSQSLRETSEALEKLKWNDMVAVSYSLG